MADDDVRDPLTLLADDRARARERDDPCASLCTLASVDAAGHPQARTLVLRDVDDRLVSAYLARAALDYLVGFTLSPMLWRKLPCARSAGRVQSVALRLVAEREQEMERFLYGIQMILN